LNESNYSCNLRDPIVLDKSTKLKSQSNTQIYPLNTFIYKGMNKNSISSIALTFKKDAKLCQSAGIKFFSESKGINLIQHVLAGTSAPITNIPPLIFKRPNVYYNSYFNPEGLRMYEQNQTSNLPCVVYGIPKSWRHVCWLLDTITTEILKFEENKMSFIPK